MSTKGQPSVADIFKSRRRIGSHVGHNPAKLRKVLLDDSPESGTDNDGNSSVISTVTKLMDAHLMPPSPTAADNINSAGLKTPTKQDACASLPLTPPGSSKRDSKGQCKVSATPVDRSSAGESACADVAANVLFTHGSSPPVSSQPSRRQTRSSRILFHKMTQLSPKKASMSPSRSTVVPFEKVGQLSPKKKVTDAKQTVSELKNLRARMAKVKSDLPTKLDRATDKSQKQIEQLKSVSGLRDRLRQINDFRLANEKSPVKTLKSDVSAPRLSPRGMTVACSRKLSDAVEEASHVADEIKVSPIKPDRICREYLDRLYKDGGSTSQLSLPFAYRFLVELFRNMDQIVSLKFNRRELIRLDDVKVCVQTAMKRDFTSKHVRQVNRVFPEAFHFVWQQLKSRFGTARDEYEMHVNPHLDYEERLMASSLPAKSSEHGMDYKCDPTAKMTPKHLVDRRLLFRGLLVSVVRDRHRKFLENLQTPVNVDEAKLVRWHTDFDVESMCSEVDELALPDKPATFAVTKASEVFNDMQRKADGAEMKSGSVRNLFGDSTDSLAAKPPASPKKVLNGLSGLPDHLIAKIMAKEEQKRRAAMIMSSGDRQRIGHLQDLKQNGQRIINCLVSESQRTGRSAIPLPSAAKFLANSLGTGDVKSWTEVCRLMAEVAVDFVQIVTLNRIEFVKLKPKRPAIAQLMKTADDEMERLQSKA